MLSVHLPSSEEDLATPATVLKRRQVKRGAGFITQVLVHWSGVDAGLATWENETEMRAKFPKVAACGQASFEGGGNVMNRQARKWKQRKEHATRRRNEAEEAAAAEKSQESAAAAEQRPTRVKKANPRYIGDSWTK